MYFTKFGVGAKFLPGEPVSMNKTKIAYSILGILFGIFFIIYGGIDDSPGGQLLGLVAVIAGIVGIVKSKKKNSG